MTKTTVKSTEFPQLHGIYALFTVLERFSMLSLHFMFGSTSLALRRRHFDGRWCACRPEIDNWNRIVFPAGHAQYLVSLSEAVQ